MTSRREATQKTLSTATSMWPMDELLSLQKRKQFTFWKEQKNVVGSIQHRTPRASIKNILPKILRIWISEGNPFPFRKVLVYVGTLFLSVLSSRWPREDCCLYDSLGFVSNHHCTWKGRGHHWLEGYHDSLPWPLSAFREKASSKTSPDWKISKRSKRVCTNWPLSLIKKVSK